MRNATLWRALLGVERTVIEEVEYDESEGVMVAYVRPTRSVASRCGRCGRRNPRCDPGEAATTSCPELKRSNR